MAKRTVVTPDSSTDAAHADAVQSIFTAGEVATAEAISDASAQVAAEATSELNKTEARLVKGIQLNTLGRSVGGELTAQFEDALGESEARNDSNLDGAVGRLIKEIRLNSVARSLRGDLISVIEEGLGEVSSAATAELAAAVKLLSDRIGIESTVATSDGIAQVIATVTPEPNTAVRLEVKVVAHRKDGLEAAIYRLIVLIRAVPSSEVLTVSGLPNDGSQVAIDGKTYTLQTVLTDVDGNVQLGVDAATTIDNLVAAINRTGTPGTDYAASMTLHPTFSASKASASTMEAVAKAAGAAANGSSVTDPVDVGAVLAWGAATTSGGLDLAEFGKIITTEYEDDAAWDVTAAVNGTDYEISVAGVADTEIEWKASVQTLEVFLA